MAHEVFNECVVYGRKFLSNRARGNHSSVICAFWLLIEDCEEELNFGKIDYFFRHTICYDLKKITHIFAKVIGLNLIYKQTGSQVHILRCLIQIL